jgi:hypothetical protein
MALSGEKKHLLNVLNKTSSGAACSVAIDTNCNNRQYLSLQRIPPEMSGYLAKLGIRIFDDAKFACPHPA